MPAGRSTPAEVRPCRRSDRDQLTDLVNAHVEAVLPGVTLPPNAVLGQLAVFRPPAHVRDPAQVDADADALVRVGLAVVGGWGATMQGDLTAGGTRSRLAGWADTWELWVRPDHRRRGIAIWLVGLSADRLRLGGARLLLDHAILAPTVEASDGLLPFLAAVGFTELTWTRRGWHR